MAIGIRITAGQGVDEGIGVGFVGPGIEIAERDSEGATAGEEAVVDVIGSRTAGTPSACGRLVSVEEEFINDVGADVVQVHHRAGRYRHVAGVR